MKPNELENLPSKLNNIYLSLEQDIMTEIVKGVKKIGGISDSAAYLYERQIALSKSTDEINKAVAKTLKLSEKEVAEMFAEAMRLDYDRSKPLYEAQGMKFIPYSENLVLQQQIQSMIEQTNGELVNITRSLGFVTDRPMLITDFYKATLDKASISIQSGAFTYDQVLRKAVNTMVTSGVRHIDYASGTHNRIEVATRRATMTSITQLANGISESNAKKLGADLYEVTTHSGARATGDGYFNHRSWQGKVYTMAQLESICGYGQGGGLGGWNCRHTFFPFIKGMSERNYTNEQLRDIAIEEDKPREYAGEKFTLYEATQRQRNLETRMRAQRESIVLAKEGGASDKEQMLLKGKYKTTMAQYNTFSNAMNLPTQKARIYVDGLGRV